LPSCETTASWSLVDVRDFFADRESRRLRGSKPDRKRPLQFGPEHRHAHLNRRRRSVGGELEWMGLGIRLRVRGSSVSIKPVSAEFTVYRHIRHEIPSVWSAIENTTGPAALWR